MQLGVALAVCSGQWDVSDSVIWVLCRIRHSLLPDGIWRQPSRDNIIIVWPQKVSLWVEISTWRRFKSSIMIGGILRRLVGRPGLGICLICIVTHVSWAAALQDLEGVVLNSLFYQWGGPKTTSRYLQILPIFILALALGCRFCLLSAVYELSCYTSFRCHPYFWKYSLDLFLNFHPKIMYKTFPASRNSS